MSDTITLRLRLSDADVRAIESRLKSAGAKPMEVRVHATGLEKIKQESSFAEGSLGQLKEKVRQLTTEMQHLGDSDAIKQKTDEIRAMESRMDSLLGKTRAGGGGGLAGAATVGAASKGVGAGEAALLGGFLPKLTGVGVAVIGVTALTAAMVDGAKKAIELDTEVRNIGSLGVANFERFGAIAKDLSTRIPQTSAEIAKGTYQAISAGISDAQSATFVEVAAKAGVAGLSSTETAVNALSSVINAYKLNASQAGQVSDQMFTAVKLGKTTFEEINAAIANVVPTAASAGIGFDQISAGIATMTKQGIPTAQASTQMRQAIVELLKPGEELAAIMEKAGIANGTAALKTLGLQGTLQKLQVAAQDSGLSMTQVFSSVEAGSAALALTGDNAAMAASDLDAMAHSAGAMGQAFDINSKSAANQLKILQNNVDVVEMSLAETFGPAMNWVLENFAGGLAKINEAFSGTEARLERMRQNGKVAFSDEGDRQLTRDRAEAARVLGLVNSQEIDNIEITEKMVKGLKAAQGATADQIKATVDYYKSLQKVTAPTTVDLTGGNDAGKPKTKRNNEPLQLALEALKSEEELATLRAKALKKSEDEMFALRLSFLERQLRVQNDFKDAAVNIAKTQNEVTKTELQRSLALMSRAAEGSVADLTKKLSELNDQISRTAPESPLFAQLLIQAEELKTKLEEVKKKASDPIYSILPGFEGFINVDEKGLSEKLKKSLGIGDKEAEELLKSYRDLGKSMGDAIGSNLESALQGKDNVGQFLHNIYRSILSETLDFIMRKAILVQVAAMLEELATKGLFGLITGGVIIGVITGMTSAAKGAITGYASGGVIVGESGPEIIAPARDFSDFAGSIVNGALQAFEVAISRLDQADRESSRSNVQVGIQADPVDLRIRGGDLRQVLDIHERRNSRSTFGAQ